MIFIYSFTCLNITILYALHNLFHGHHEITFHEKETDHKILTEANCTVFKVINSIDESNSTLKVKIVIESLSSHILKERGIAIPLIADIFFDPEPGFFLIRHTTILDPPPKLIS